MSMASIRERGGPSSSAAATTQMPPGVKFSPTDGELMGYYLYNHIRRTLPPAHYSTIRCHDLYGDDEPWEVWQRLQSGEEPGDVYAFTELKKKVKSCGGKAKRSARKVGKNGGSWHGEDSGTEFKLIRRSRSPAESDERWVGIRKRFSYRNPNPNFAYENLKWILHQFSMRRDDDGFGEDEKEVVCMIRNNGSPTGNAIVEAARRRILAGRKRKLEDYIKQFCSNGDSTSSIPSSSKRVCYQDQEPPLLPTVVDCPNYAAPLPTMEQQSQKPQVPEPVQDEELGEFDIMASIDFDIQDCEFDWGDQGFSGIDPQSVLEFPQDYQEATIEPVDPLQYPPSGADCFEPAAAIPAVEEDDKPKTASNADCFEPAAADPVVKQEDDAGEVETMAAAAQEDGAPEAAVVPDNETMVADRGDGRGAAGSSSSSRYERIVLPWDVPKGSGDCCYGGQNVGMNRGSDPVFWGLGDILDVPLSVQFPPSYGVQQQVYPVEGDDCEATSYVDLWGYDSIEKMMSAV